MHDGVLPSGCMKVVPSGLFLVTCMWAVFIGDSQGLLPVRDACGLFHSVFHDIVIRCCCFVMWLK